jgi:group I intron endonuclease
MASYTVYVHTFPNGKRYVGITCQDVKRRWRDGKGYEGQVVYGAILKYGWNNVKHEILFDGLTKEQAEEEEKALIKRYDTTSHANGYNVELGGNATGKVSDESKRKNSESHKGLMAGEKHWHYGQHWSDEVKKKISEASKGKKISDETRLKQSAIFSGKGNPMYGTKMSAEHKKKLQAACVKATSKPVVCVETGKVYKSAAQAQRETGICSSTIRYVANRDKRYKTAGGYHWEYKEVS